jgi:hypothetical protein
VKFVLLHIAIAPFAAFGMILLWAVLGIPVIGNKTIMLEEWFVCIGVYLLLLIGLKLKKWFTSRV